MIQKKKTKFGIILLVSIIVTVISWFYYKNSLISIIFLVGTFSLSTIYSIASRKMQESNDIRRMEELFPDFIELVSSNLRAGITVDKALLLSSRKEFAPLDAHILELGKDITTGKDIAIALRDMGKRINSEKINKTISLIVSGLKAGGDIAILLEETASNIREREFVEKRASSNVLMYIIFIFFAVSVGAPGLFALSAVLVKIMTSILANMPSGAASTGLPFNLKSISISIEFITYFSIVFILISDVLASLLLGLVSKGQERAGIKYILPIVAISMAVYIILRIVLAHYLGSFFG